MAEPPRSDEPDVGPIRSRRRWIWYGAGVALALVILVLVGLVLSREGRPPASAVNEPSTSPQPAPHATPPAESEPGSRTGGGGPTSAPPGGGGGGGAVGAEPGPPAVGAEASPPPPPPLRKKSATPKIPQFPWPPPRASASVELPAEFLRKSANAGVHWGDVDHTLTSALDSCGYYDRSYYAVPDGFAIVTRLEQMQADGSSKAPPDRWSVAYKPVSGFSLSSYLRALFTADPGFYRIIVFVVTPQFFSQTPIGVSEEEAMQWLQGGLDRLPLDLAMREYTDQYACTALIYQFEQPGSGAGARLDVPSDLPGRIHLERANLWRALAK